MSDDIKIGKILMTLCLGLILLVFIDEGNLREIRTVGVVSDKIFIPPHRAQTSTGYIYTAGDFYILIMSFDGFKYQIYPGSNDYNKTKIGDSVEITYRKSRIFSSIVVISCLY